MTSRMAAEIAECPRVAHEAAGMTPAFHRLAAGFRQAPPQLVVLCGRGSSGHAALFLRYLFETRLLTPVSLAAPSVASAYKSRMRLAGAWFILLSQSGESPDLIEATRAAQAAGALTIGFVNAPNSTLGKSSTSPSPCAPAPRRRSRRPRACWRRWRRARGSWRKSPAISNCTPRSIACRSGSSARLRATGRRSRRRFSTPATFM